MDYIGRKSLINEQRNNNNKIRSCARHVSGYITMKKSIFVFAVLITMVASATVFANSHKDANRIHNHDVLTTHVAVQGKHCTGTVGCSCTGFSPITDGDVWQQAYCKHCRHKKSCHK